MIKTNDEDAKIASCLNFEAVANLPPLLEDHLALVVTQPAGVRHDHRHADGVPDQDAQALVHLHKNLQIRRSCKSISIIYSLDSP